MKTRIISGLCMVPLIAILYFRGIPLVVAAFIIGAVGVFELFKGFEKMDIKPNLFVAWGALVVLYALHFALPGRHDYLMLWIVLSIVASFVSCFNIEKHRIEDSLATILGILYVELFSYHVVMIDQTGRGLLVWMVAITAFCTDIMAYFTGVFFGKRKLCPDLSPKKTVEGALGGILGAVIGSVIFGLIIKSDIFIHLMIMGVFGSVMAQLGDLSASMFKRKMGIKDYGNIIPGHGGVMDRFDSILFTAPAIYYYIQLVLGS